jgi:hypothetical protein
LKKFARKSNEIDALKETKQANFTSPYLHQLYVSSHVIAAVGWRLTSHYVVEVTVSSDPKRTHNDVAKKAVRGSRLLLAVSPQPHQSVVASKKRLDHL